MSFARKQQLVFALLVLFATWPAAHFALVQTHDLSPWKYGGWAMYTTPHIRPHIVLWKDTRGRWEPLDASELAPETLRAVEETLTSIAAEPRRETPRLLAERIARDFPRARRVRVEVRMFEVDPETAYVRATPRYFDVSNVR